MGFGVNRPSTCRVRMTNKDVINDEKNVPASADLLQVTQPAHAGGIETTFALNGFDNHGGRPVDPAGWIIDHFFEHSGRIHRFAKIAVVRHRRDPVQRNSGRIPMVGIARGRHGTKGDPVEAIGEGDDVVPTGDVPGELQRGLDRISACRPCELDPVFEPSRFE